MTLDGKPTAFLSPSEAMAAGVGLIARDRIEESTATGLSIRENTFLNPRAIGRGPFSLLSPRREAERAREIGARVGLGPTSPICRSRRCRAATSRRWWSGAGSKSAGAC